MRAVRVVDLDRDMSDVIPTGMTPDSEYLFQRMTDVTLDRALPGPGRCILDVASGVGQDSIALAARGARVVGAEPSRRMTQMARLFAAERLGDPAAPDLPSAEPGQRGSRRAAPRWVHGWADRLPFASRSFDAVLCKGAIDHFDQPEQAIAEMARVTKDDGRVVLAIANFESLACRVGRAVDAFARDSAGGPCGTPRLRRPERPLHALRARPDARAGGGSPRDRERRGHLGRLGNARLVEATARLPRAVAFAAVQALDALARVATGWADVIVLVGRPRRSASTSS